MKQRREDTEIEGLASRGGRRSRRRRRDVAIPPGYRKPTDSFVYTNRPLNPNGEIPAYGKIPKLEMPPLPVAGSPGLRLRSGYTSKMLSAPRVSVYRRSEYDAFKSVIVFA